MLNHVSLIPYRRNDREAFLSLFRNDANEMYYQPTLEIRGMARRFLEGSHEGYGKNWTDKNYLALLDRQVIGCGSIARRHSNGEISCYVHPDYRRRGYGSEILEELPVSYTHLDVYKRQGRSPRSAGRKKPRNWTIITPPAFW